MTQKTQLDWENRFHIIEGIARGLLYLHNYSRSSIHWDLKTSNILFDNYKYSKISDFGLARTFGENESKAKHKKGISDFGLARTFGENESKAKHKKGCWDIGSDHYFFCLSNNTQQVIATSPSTT